MFYMDRTVLILNKNKLIFEIFHVLLCIIKFFEKDRITAQNKKKVIIKRLNLYFIYRNYHLIIAL